MDITLISGERASSLSDAVASGDDLWLWADDLSKATGWERKPQGMCLGDRCVPLSPALEGALLDANGRVNFAAFARHLRMPVVHDDDANVWLAGEPAATRADALRSLEAPDFRLPDLDGVRHALSDYRGKKVLLLSWASW